MVYVDPAEVAWHIDKIANAAGRKTIFLSHHQLFTAFGDSGVGQDPNTNNPLSTNSNLWNGFRSILPDLSLWIWGHEHTLNIFKPYAGLGKGRCVGASAVPVLGGQNPYQPNPKLQNIIYEPNIPALLDGVPILPVNANGEYFHAFAVLQLNPSTLASTAAYYQIDSANHAAPHLVFTENL